MHSNQSAILSQQAVADGLARSRLLRSRAFHAALRTILTTGRSGLAALTAGGRDGSRWSSSGGLASAAR